MRVRLRAKVLSRLCASLGIREPNSTSGLPGKAVGNCVRRSETALIRNTSGQEKLLQVSVLADIYLVRNRQPQSGINMSTTATAPAQQKCVLLIEDNEDVMLMVQFALQEYGQGKYRLKWVNRLRDGLDQIRKGGIDVVLLDLGLPESSATASYAWVRAVSPKLPILVLTGETIEFTQLTVLAGGVDDFSVKDLVSGKRLFATIQATLSRKR
jgi:CheY-like chemotaxis protein